jgi:hypothetical protein
MFAMLDDLSYLEVAKLGEVFLAVVKLADELLAFFVDRHMRANITTLGEAFVAARDRT